MACKGHLNKNNQKVQQSRMLRKWCSPGNAFSCSCDNGASGGRTGVGDTSGMMLTSPGRFVEYGSRITFNDVHLNNGQNLKSEKNREKKKRVGKKREAKQLGVESMCCRLLRSQSTLCECL